MSRHLHNHPLVRHNNAQSFYSQDAFICNLCKKNCRGRVFHCGSCNFDVCPGCMGTHLRNNAKHVHSLNIYTTSPYGPNKPSIAVCDICRATIKNGEQAYHCDTCRDYDNCRACYLKYQSPHQHPMRPFDRAPYNSRTYNCDYCTASYGETPGYHCDACGNFDACPSCYGKFATAGGFVQPMPYPQPVGVLPGTAPMQAPPGVYTNPLPGAYPTPSPGQPGVYPPPGGHPPGVQPPQQPVNISVSLAVNQPGQYPPQQPGQYPPQQPNQYSQPGQPNAPLNFPGQPGQYPPQQYPPQQPGVQQPGQYPPQSGQYPPQQYPSNNQPLNFPGQPQGQPGQYPPQQYPPQQPSYQTHPPQQPQYTTHSPQGQPGYPPQQYPPQQGGYPPQQGGQPGYPPQQGGQPGYPPQQGGYPPQGQPGYPPQQGGYPPQGQSGYPAQQGGYPPQQGGQPGYPPQGGYPPQQGGYPQGQPNQYPQPGQYPPSNGKPTPY